MELEKLKQRMARILEEKSASENALLKLKVIKASCRKWSFHGLILCRKIINSTSERQ